MVLSGATVGLQRVVSRAFLGLAVLLVCCLMVPDNAIAGQAALTWNASTDPSVAGYNIYFGNASRSYSGKLNAGKSTSYMVPNLTGGATYYFAVTAYNSAGIESSFSNEASVIIPLPVGAPVAGFSSPITSGTAPLVVSFTNSSSGSISTYSWNFGDGSTSGLQNPSHTYASPGTYTVSLTVGGSGGTNTLTRTGYIVVAAPSANVAANFSSTRQAGPAPLSVGFTDGSTGTISGYRWDFGDGSSSTLKNPSHTYTSPGVYSVTLTVTGSGGTKSVTKSGYIKVGMDNDLVIDFGASYGLWQWLNNTTWSQIHSVNAKHIVIADIDHNGQPDEVIDFGSQYGIWIRMNNANWVPLHGVSANWIAKGDFDNNGQDDLVVDFGASYGIWIYYNGSSWTQIQGASGKLALSADVDHNGREDIVIDFGGTLGVWAYLNGTSWKQIDARSPAWMIKADLDNNGQDDLVMSFGAGTGAAQAYPGKGIWAYLNGSTWRQIDARTIASARAVAIDIDHNGDEDLAIDFGSNGLWLYKNGTTWTKLHSVSAKHLANADLDSNQQHDLVADFGTQYGVFVLMNGQTWKQLHSITSSSIAPGQVDAQ